MNSAEFHRIYQNNLTIKQRQVLKGLLKGLSNREIARKIDVTTGNISHHIKNSARKFGIQQNLPRDYLIELFINYKPELVCAVLKQKYGLDLQKHYYQVGGTLPINCASYVERKSDRILENSLLNGEYCLVLNPRQTGKSSLKVRTIDRLKKHNIKYVSIDITLLGSNEEQSSRSKGFIAEVFSQLNIQLDINRWWEASKHLTLMQRLNKAIAQILTQLSDKIIIFIDEIDSIPNTDDFFAFIRACYNQRAEKPDYNRLTFCLLGVASPQDLMKNKQRTPFNIGKVIDLPGFNFDEAKDSLPNGLINIIDNPEKTLKEILFWTGGQPFLTQKLCALVRDNSVNKQVNISQIIQTQIVNNWQKNDSPLHFTTISDRLLKKDGDRVKLLELYQRILCDRNSKIVSDYSQEERQLVLSGLIVKDDRFIKITNPIYQQIFNLDLINYYIRESS